ncbi:MAG: YjbF family lipoprotein [Pseudomonadota bacterium]
MKTPPLNLPRACLLGLLVLVTGCSDEGVNPVFEAALEEVNPFDGDGDAAAGEAAPTRTAPSRAAIERADVATIRARLVTDNAATYLLATSRNGPYVTYVSALRQGLTLAGTQVTGTRGLGFDLLSATSSQPDPLTRPIPVASWPDGVTRSFEFPASGPQGRIDTYECRFERGETRQITILEKTHTGIEVSEVCTGPSGSFENLHFADASSGQVWRSLQWTGPRQGLIDIEVVLPFTGNTN